KNDGNDYFAARCRGGYRMGKKKKRADAPKPTPERAAGRTQYDVTAEQFVRAWQTSETAQEVADRLKMPKPIVLARASAYRKDGVKLKKLKRTSSRALD